MRQLSHHPDELIGSFNCLAEEHQGTTKIEVRVIGRKHELRSAAFEEIRAIGCEAIRNALLHANATLIVVELRFGWKDFVMSVSDDGPGIPQEVLTLQSREGHWGLPGMRERTTKVGGKLTISNRRGSGAVISVCIPAWGAYADRRTFLQRCAAYFSTPFVDRSTQANP